MTNPPLDYLDRSTGLFGPRNVQIYGREHSAARQRCERHRPSKWRLDAATVTGRTSPNPATGPSGRVAHPPIPVRQFRILGDYGRPAPSVARGTGVVHEP